MVQRIGIVGQKFDIATRQVYADITPLGGPTYWIGKRFYAREDIHINVTILMIFLEQVLGFKELN